MRTRIVPGLQEMRGISLYLWHYSYLECAANYLN